MVRVFLASCVARKGAELTPAAELYTSTWFIKVRKLIEASGQPWFILSAVHGLLHPDTVVAPYDRILNTMTATEREDWAGRVRQQMELNLPKADEVVVMAGRRYRENLMPFLSARFPKVTVPMVGLTIGRQLNWLNHATEL